MNTFSWSFVLSKAFFRVFFLGDVILGSSFAELIVAGGALSSNESRFSSSCVLSVSSIRARFASGCVSSAGWFVLLLSFCMITNEFTVDCTIFFRLPATNCFSLARQLFRFVSLIFCFFGVVFCAATAVREVLRGRLGAVDFSWVGDAGIFEEASAATTILLIMSSRVCLMTYSSEERLSIWCRILLDDESVKVCGCCCCFGDFFSVSGEGETDGDNVVEGVRHGWLSLVKRRGLKMDEILNFFELE